MKLRNILKSQYLAAKNPPFGNNKIIVYLNWFLNILRIFKWESVRLWFAVKNHSLNLLMKRSEFKQRQLEQKNIIPIDFVFGFQNFAEGINFDVSFYRHEEVEEQYTLWKKKHGKNDPFVKHVKETLDEQDFLLSINHFPYYLEPGLKHFLLWTHQVDQEKIVAFLDQHFEHFRVFSNNFRTTKLNHYHVFVKFSDKNKQIFEEFGFITTIISRENLISFENNDHKKRLIAYHRNRSKVMKLFSNVIPYLDGLTWWVNGGTLLGAIRHKNMILFDDDIDISILEDEFTILKNKLVEAGFEIITITTPWDKNFYRITEPKESWPFIDVMTFNLIGATFQSPSISYKMRRPFSISKKDLKPLTYKKLGNLIVKAPNNPYPLLNDLFADDWPDIAKTHYWDHVQDQHNDFAGKKIYINEYDALELRTITSSIQSRWDELPIPSFEVIPGGLYLYPKQLDFIVNITRKMNCQLFVECGFGSGHLTTAVLESNPLCHVLTFDLFETTTKKNCVDFISESYPGRFTPVTGDIQDTLIHTLNRMNPEIDIAYISIPHYEMHNIFHLKDYTKIFISTPLDGKNHFFNNWENSPYVNQLVKVTEENAVLSRDVGFGHKGSSFKHSWVVGQPIVI